MTVDCQSTAYALMVMAMKNRDSKHNIQRVKKFLKLSVHWYAAIRTRGQIIKINCSLPKGRIIEGSCFRILFVAVAYSREPSRSSRM